MTFQSDRRIHSFLFPPPRFAALPGRVCEAFSARVASLSRAFTPITRAEPRSPLAVAAGFFVCQPREFCLFARRSLALSPIPKPPNPVIFKLETRHLLCTSPRSLEQNHPMNYRFTTPLLPITSPISRFFCSSSPAFHTLPRVVYSIAIPLKAAISGSSFRSKREFQRFSVSSSRTFFEFNVGLVGLVRRLLRLNLCVSLALPLSFSVFVSSINRGQP
jgi:hypothetical protein